MSLSTPLPSSDTATAVTSSWFGAGPLSEAARPGVAARSTEARRGLLRQRDEVNQQRHLTRFLDPRIVDVGPQEGIS
jgi:hypothetical protein